MSTPEPTAADRECARNGLIDVVYQYGPEPKISIERVDSVIKIFAEKIAAHLAAIEPLAEIGRLAILNYQQVKDNSVSVDAYVVTASKLNAAIAAHLSTASQGAREGST